MIEVKFYFILHYLHKNISHQQKYLQCVYDYIENQPIYFVIKHKISVNL